MADRSIKVRIVWRLSAAQLVSMGDTLSRKVSLSRGDLACACQKPGAGATVKIFDFVPELLFQNPVQLRRYGAEASFFRRLARPSRKICTTETRRRRERFPSGRAFRQCAICADGRGESEKYAKSETPFINLRSICNRTRQAGHTAMTGRVRWQY